MHFIAHSLHDLDQIALEIIAALGARRKIALQGDMGSGKTTFTKAFCKVLGVQDMTGSPTFSLINAYTYQAEGRTCLLHHLDLYRLRSPEEAFDIGVEDLLYDPWYCIIEWPDMIESLLPADTAYLTINVDEYEGRHFELLLDSGV